jgi:hypothetical protein
MILLLVVLPTSMAHAASGFFGYDPAVSGFTQDSFGNVIFNDDMALQKSYVSLNAGAVLMDNDQYKLAKTKMGYLKARFRDVYHAKMIVDLSWVMFAQFSSGNPVDCTEYGASASEMPSPAFPIWRVRNYDPDLNNRWGARLDEFMSYVDSSGQTVAQILNDATNVAGIIVHTEINNGCVPSSVIQTVAQRVHTLVPSVPVIGGYATTIFWNTPTKQPPSGGFPGALDRILFWSYGIYNPNDINAAKNYTNYTNYPVGDPQNNHGFFFNQNDPAATWTTWGALLAKRTNNPNQKFIVVVEGWHGAAQNNHGLSIPDMGGLAQNWGTWIKGRPEVVGSVVFLWPDLGADPGSKSMMDQSMGVLAGQDSIWP